MRYLSLPACTLNGYLRLGYGWVRQDQVASGLLGVRVASSRKRGAS